MVNMTIASDLYSISKYLEPENFQTFLFNYTHKVLFEHQRLNRIFTNNNSSPIEVDTFIFKDNSFISVTTCKGKKTIELSED